VISIRGLKKVYRDEDGTEVPVLSGLDLDVAEGEFVAVVGPSGSGKSTLLNVLGGLDVHYEGEVSVAGVKLRGLHDKELSRFRGRNVGFVFQSFHLVSNLPAVDNVLLPSFFNGTEPDPRKRAEEVLERVGLGPKKDRVPARLSGGERQRVAIARALFSRPRMLFCDEPTGNLDARTGDEIITLFRELNREGITLLAVTHEDRMSQAAGRVLRLKEGRLVPEPGPEPASGEARP
jgi:putative ABC transport system ATP-binding protein